MTKVNWSNFVIWQCSLRQRNFRMFAGKPSDGTIANILDIKTEKEICNIRSVLLEKNCLNTAKMFEFMIKQTHEPEIRFDKAVKFLTAKLPISQGDRHHFLLDKVGLTETEYLECLNRATNGGFVREVFK